MNDNLPQQAAESAAERPVCTPMEGAQIAQIIQAAERAWVDVVDLPSILALRSVVLPPNDVPVVIDPGVFARLTYDRTALQPSCNLLVFKRT